MIEFSLLELREFISISNTYGLSLNEYSLITLRLALQRTCEDFKIKNFLDFVRQFQQSNEVKVAMHKRIFTHPKDLLRDAGNWQFVLKRSEAILSNKDKRVLIIDNSVGADITSFFLLCKLLKIHLSCTVDWYSFYGSFVVTDPIMFSAKDFEIAQSNLLSNSSMLEEYLILRSGDYHFDFNYPINKAEINADIQSLLPFQNKYDFVLSQNVSLKFNFAGHERFFKSCLFISNKNAVLFFGTRENLKQFSSFWQLKQPYKELNYFINEKGYY